MHQNQNNDFINHIVDVYSEMIFRIAFLHTQNRPDAEDIVQEVFISLLKQPPFNEEEHLKAWIIRVAINKCKDILKSAKRNKTVPLDAYHDTLQSELQKEEYVELIVQLQKLPEKERNILYLFYYEGYSAKEIAAIMHKKENAIFVRLNRARDKNLDGGEKKNIGTYRKFFSIELEANKIYVFIAEYDKGTIESIFVTSD